MCSMQNGAVVQVLYDFEYQTNDSRWVWMKEGEKLTALQQINEDWWQVLRADEKTPFYAPASYLELINDGTNQPENSDSGVADVSISENDEKSNNVLPSTSSSDCNIEELAMDDEYFKRDKPVRSDDSLDSPAFDNPIYANFNFPDNKRKLSEETVKENMEVPACKSDEGKRESTSPIYANLALYAGDPPVPNPKQIPVKILLHHWAEYVDNQMRKYYYNSVTGQSSWKPPRKRLDRPHALIMSDEAEPVRQRTPSAESPTLIKRASIFYDHLPQDDSLSDKTSKNRLAAKEKPRNKSDSQLNKEASASAEQLNIDKKMHVWKSSPSLMRKFKMSIRGSPLMSRKKVANNNDDKQCSAPSVFANDMSENSNPSNPQLIVTNPIYSSSEKVSSEKSSAIPEGWTKQENGDGGFYYVHNETGEKWQSSVDDTGRDYYYRVNGTESFWELPVIQCKENNEDSEQYFTPSTSPQPGRKNRRPIAAIKKFSSLDRDGRTRSLIVNSASESDVKSVTLQDNLISHDNKSITLPRSLSPPDHKHPWSDLKEVIREGQLNKTKVMEYGKRKRKDWTVSQVVLTSSRIIFYKDVKSPTSKHAAMNKPEMNFDLCGSTIDWCPEKSSRKNVFQINTVLGILILLQDDNYDVVNEWFTDIKKVILNLPTPFPTGHVVKSTSLESDINITADKNSKMSRSKSTKFTRTSDQVEGIPAANSAEKKKIKKKLKHFFLKRPTMESLTEKGIIQDEPVFGCDIIQLCNREGTTTPRFVQECIGAIEKCDMKADGLYRASGNVSQIQKIRFQVNQDIFTGVHMEEDVHVLSGCLKMFFRHMKEPLIPANVYDKLLAAIKHSKASKRVKEISENLYLLQRPNFDTLKFLLQHLLRVTAFSQYNRMHIQNLAIVFGPTLMGADSVSADLAVDMMHQNQIIELLLLEFDTVYGTAL